MPRARGDGMTDAEHKAQYRAWADRLRSKQRSLIDANRPADPEDVPPERAPGGFDFDRLEARQSSAGETESSNQLGDLLATFGLPPDATMEDVAAAYRDLVKAHHPDQHEEAAGDVRQANEQFLATASATYRALAALLADAPTDRPTQPG